MIETPELLILDVGHGNCAILRDTEAVTVIDCPPTSTLLDTLAFLEIDVIHNVLISHADYDHAAGLPVLLQAITVRNVYINPDANKKSRAWREIRVALELAHKNGTQIYPSLTSNLPTKIISGQVEIEILAPSLGVALGGSGGQDLEGRNLTSNAMSVVIGLVHDTHRIALLPGDMDEVGLDNLLRKHEQIEAQILVFPHHGGNPGTTHGQQFAQKLCDAVHPRLVVFSHGRNRLLNPRKDIMQGVHMAVPYAHVMCTQLSCHCAIALPTSEYTHLTSAPASGYTSNSCCGGTISITLNGEQTSYAPLLAAHRAFVGNKIATPLCLQFLALTNT
ncbi:MAG: MBL fold metallo-hydrolase [Ktedonobacteraceae bacterium]